MRPCFLISLIIAGALALAQSNPVSPSSQNHTEIPPSVSRFPQRLPWAARARAVKPGMSPNEVSTPGLSFANVVTYGTGGYDAMSVAVADVNGDGTPDIVVASYCTSGNQSGCTNDAGVVGVLLNNGDGTFQPVVTYSSGGNNADSVVVADVNGDGKPDIVVANYGSGGVGVLLNNGDGTFQAAVSYGSGGAAPASVAVADVNGDGKLALLVANEGAGDVGVLLGNGDGTFQPAVAYDVGAIPISVAAADLRGDGKVDAIVAGCTTYGLDDCNRQSSMVGVLLGNGDGTFQPVVSFSSGGAYPTSIAVGDVNGDGIPDVLATNLWSCGTPPPMAVPLVQCWAC